MPSLQSRTAARRLAAGAGVAALLVALAATAAQAAVTVIPDTTVGGTPDTQILFRVPTASSSASTVKVEVGLPSSPPLLSVSTAALPGWNAAVTDAKLPAPIDVDGATLTKAPADVTWTAASGNGIKPDQYQDFAIVVDPLPDSGVLTFPTTQTYSNGSVVRWDDPPVTGATTPQYPAPSFALTTAADTGGTAAGTTATAADHDGVTVGAIAIAFAVLALALAFSALVRVRRIRRV